MSGQIIATINLSLELVALLVGASMLLGAFDIIRQPGRVWRQAEESKPAYLILVLLLPIVGLALYAFMARPKLVALAGAGHVDEIHRQDDRATTTMAPLGSDSLAETVGPHEEPVVEEATPSAPSGPVDISSTFFSNKGSRTARLHLGLTLSHRPKQRTRPAVEDNIEDVEQVEDNVEADEVATTFSNKGSHTPRSRLSRILSYRLTGRRKQGTSPAVQETIEDVEQAAGVEADEVPTTFSSEGSRTDRSRLSRILSYRLTGRRKQGTSPAVQETIEDVEQAEGVEADEVATTSSSEGSRTDRSRLSRILSFQLTGRRKQGTSPAVEDKVEHVEQAEGNVEAKDVPTAPAGWKTDPSGRHQIRYWDGSHWTEHVADADHQATGDQANEDQPSDDRTSDDKTEESADSRPRSRRLAVPYRR
ncbi:MAG: DUF2510 domain-containing protein [Acidimicrobiales bacterium]|nr:DUF2510 domain-containing protein [Acidimicrobiales bacterium]